MALARQSGRSARQERIERRSAGRKQENESRSNPAQPRLRPGRGRQQRTHRLLHPRTLRGPDYSPDGKWIYFNSSRTGRGRIWRIPADGAGSNDARAEQITHDDDYEDWFPHPSPDGKWLVFLSYPKGTPGHPPNKNVVLRRMPLPGDANDEPGEIRELARLFGGQGTINVNSWSPDSRHFAYVRYAASPSE